MTNWTDELSKVRCRFGCDDPVVGIYHIPEGCACFPDPIQALCAQHFIKSESDGPVIALVYRPWRGSEEDVMDVAEPGGQVQEPGRGDEDPG